MKYIANPVEVDAFRIRNVSEIPKPTIDELEKIINEGHDPMEGLILLLDDGSEDGRVVNATPDMISRMTPVVGDYWVVQADGYIYLNPKDVFLRKYRPKEEAQSA